MCGGAIPTSPPARCWYCVGGNENPEPCRSLRQRCGSVALHSAVNAGGLRVVTHRCARPARVRRWRAVVAASSRDSSQRPRCVRAERALALHWSVPFNKLSVRCGKCLWKCGASARVLEVSSRAAPVKKWSGRGDEDPELTVADQFVIAASPVPTRPPGSLWVAPLCDGGKSILAAKKKTCLGRIDRR